MSEDPTHITMRTVLEAVNALGVELHNFRGEMQEFRAETNRRFDDLERKIDVLNRDMLQLRADYAGLDRRVSRLEPELKPS